MRDDHGDLPLVIDLDGTLLRTDSLHETLLDLLRSNPLALWELPYRLAIGRAAVKDFLARGQVIDADAWPVHEDFLSYLEKQAAVGRRIVLATAADRAVADAIARRFPFITEVIASDGSSNLKGRAKADRLRQAFPEGFIYAGNSEPDYQVWETSRHSILVSVPEGLAQRVRRLGTPLAEFPRQRIGLDTVRRTLRLHQWAKNLLIFIPLVLGGRGSDINAWIAALLGFLALGLAASATYILNDLLDLPSDRRHWSKKSRPLASGELSIAQGTLLAIVGLVAATAIAISAGTLVLALLGLYVAMTTAYSFLLKRIPVLDVLVLAALFTFRLGFGIVLTQVRLSPWLLVFSMFVFMSLSMAKRHTEVLRMGANGLTSMHGRGYVAQDAPLMLAIGVAAMLGAVLILILYLIEDAFPRGFYGNPAALWAVPAILFLFLGRVWLLCQRGQLRDDPVAFALKDKPSLALAGLMAITFAIAVLHVGGA
ncbi:UbiA family prenyltransferase [Bradyrhizobium sp. Gha]|uniref:UbiA family prenyltransferase n=1 Tax=Bradyrhizobium sp. Gha TaxID=1855318 RepID=UPI0008DF82F0|nr:UbiA family prenyltransferase [Bradyrhizobium sp. Gha]SFI08607.1 4-hydroxybenzoate polyprenyltransferase [Bradyrhizobium sp. Gha]